MRREALFYRLPVQDVCWMNPRPLSSPLTPPLLTACISIKLLSDSVRDSAEVQLEIEKGFRKKKKKSEKEECQTSTGSGGKNSFPQPRSAPQAERMRSPLNVPSSNQFQYSLFSKSNTCDIKIKQLSPDLCSSFPDKINRARQHKEKLAASALQLHMKVRPNTQPSCPRNFEHKIIVKVLNRELITKILCYQRWNKKLLSAVPQKQWDIGVRWWTYERLSEGSWMICENVQGTNRRVLHPEGG